MPITKYDRPTQFQYRNTLPFEAIAAAGSMRQQQYDTNLAKADAIADVISKVQSVEKDTKQKKAILGDYESKIDKAIEDAGGDYGQLSGFINSTNRELQKDLTRGKLSSIQTSYDQRTAYQKSLKELLNKDPKKGGIILEDFNNLMTASDRNYKGIGEIDPETETYAMWSGITPAGYVDGNKMAIDLASKMDPQVIAKNTGWRTITMPNGEVVYQKGKVTTSKLPESVIRNAVLQTMMDDPKLMGYLQQHVQYATSPERDAYEQEYGVEGIDEYGRPVQHAPGDASTNMQNKLSKILYDFADNAAGLKWRNDILENDVSMRDSAKWGYDYKQDLEDSVPTFTNLMHITSKTGMPSSTQELVKLEKQTEQTIEHSQNALTDYYKNAYPSSGPRPTQEQLNNDPHYNTLKIEYKQATKVADDLKAHKKAAEEYAGITEEFWQGEGKKTLAMAEAARESAEKKAMFRFSKQGNLSLNDNSYINQVGKDAYNDAMRRSAPMVKYNQKLKELSEGDTNIMGFTTFDNVKTNNAMVLSFNAFASDTKGEGGSSQLLDASQNPIDYKEFADKQDPSGKVIYGGYGYVDGQLYNVFRYPLINKKGYSEPVLMPAPLGVQEHIGHLKNDYTEQLLMSQINSMHKSGAGGTVPKDFGISGVFGKGKDAVKLDPLQVRLTVDDDKDQISGEQYRMFLPNGTFIGFTSVGDLKAYYYDMIKETLKK